MINRVLSMSAAVFLLLNLCACRASFSDPSVPTISTADTTVPTQEATTPPETLPAQQYVEVMREGEVSRIPVQIVSGQAGSYTIAMDPEYFTFTPLEAGDLFSYEAWGSAQPVYYRITPYGGAYDPDVFSSQNIPSGYEPAETQSITLGGYPASVICMNGTGENAGYCLHRYLLDCGDICYSIEARFSQEMYEGLYAIMRALFETFTAM